MKATIHHHSGDYSIDFSKPIDISIHTDESSSCSKAWYVDPIKIEPVMTDQFTGSVKAGGTVNFRNIFLILMAILRTRSVLVILQMRSTIYKNISQNSFSKHK